MPIFWDAVEKENEMPEIKITTKEIRNANKARIRLEQEEESKKRREHRKMPDLKIVEDKKIKVDLRDYFIAAALTGLCGNTGYMIQEQSDIETITKVARRIADEMLIERTR